MATTIKKVQLWKCQVDNRPGALDAILAPLAEAGADLSIVFGWVNPGDPTRATIEVAPIRGKKITEAARSVGLEPDEVPVIVVEGLNKPGLGHRLAEAIAAKGINMTFVVAQVVGRNYGAVFGFQSAEDATKATRIIKTALAARKGTNRRKSTKKKAALARR